MKYKIPKETTLFNANHITIIKRDGIESTEVSVADNTNSTQVELGGTHNYFGNKEVYKKEKCVSPLGFYYIKETKVRPENNKKSIYMKYRHVVVTANHISYSISYLIECGEQKIDLSTHPWDICYLDKSLSESMIKSLEKVLTEVFNSVSGTKKTEIDTVRNSVFKDLFGDENGIKVLANDIKITSHGFDLKTSFRNVK